MKAIKDLLGGKGAPRGQDSSLNTSLDTSSMNTAETDSTCPRGEEASSEFPDCPFLGHKMYVPLKEHYRAALGLMYLARRRDTGQKVVIKLLERGPGVTRAVAEELLLHRACCGHPLFAQLLDVFLAPQHLAIVMEWVPGGDILELVEVQGALPEDLSRWLFQQLVVGLQYLHKAGAPSRDIKLQNKLLSWPDDATAEAFGVGKGKAAAVRRGSGPSGILSRMSPTAATRVARAASAPAGAGPMERSPSPGPPLASVRPGVKIQDFAYSKSEQINSDPHSALSSLPYTAPEVLSCSMGQGEAADVWALGVALFKMATGFYPFERPGDEADARAGVQAVLGRIARVDYVIPEDLSPELRDLLARMLVAAPEQRLGLAALSEHPWVAAGMPADLVRANADADPDKVAPMSEDALRAVISEAQVSLRPFASDDVDDLADEILNEEEADDLLDELALG